MLVLEEINEQLKRKEMLQVVPVVSLEASKESGLSTTGTTLKPMDIARVI